MIDTNTLLRIIKLHESLIAVFLVDRDEQTLVYLHKHEEKEESLVKQTENFCCERMRVLFLWKSVRSI